MPIQYDVGIWFFINCFEYVWNVLSMPMLLRVFSMMAVRFFSDAFSASIEAIIWFLLCSFLMWCNILEIAYVKLPPHTRNKPHVVQVNDLIYWYILFAVVLEKKHIFCIYSFMSIIIFSTWPSLPHSYCLNFYNYLHLLYIIPSLTLNWIVLKVIQWKSTSLFN